jgi:NTE family protein
MKRDIALTLSGGAAWGIAHVGVLRAIEEADLHVAGVSGTSVGALIGTLYAFGTPVPELEERARNVNWPRLTRPSLRHLGILSMQRLRESIREWIGAVDLDSAPIPLRLMATDLSTGEGVALSTGPADAAIVASCSIPGLIQPVEWEGRLLADGGLVNNLPVGLARELNVGPVVASDVHMPGPYPLPENIFDVILRSLSIMVEHAPAHERGSADVLISPDVSEFGIADLSKREELLQAGYDAARQALWQAETLP